MKIPYTDNHISLKSLAIGISAIPLTLTAWLFMDNYFAHASDLTKTRTTFEISSLDNRMGLITFQIDTMEFRLSRYQNIKTKNRYDRNQIYKIKRYLVRLNKEYDRLAVEKLTLETHLKTSK